MNITKPLALVLLIAVTHISNAWLYASDRTAIQTESSDPAVTTAIKFLQNRDLQLQRQATDNLLREIALTETKSVRAYNIGNDNGFVLVAENGSDEPLVIGYSDEGQIDGSTLPVPFLEWISSCERTMDSGKLSRVTRSVANNGPVTRTHPIVLPLLTVQWNQTAPFNLFCPEGCPTGCVATAMAQVMAYYQWPKTYEWDEMNVFYIGFETTEACERVAHLMRDCGEAVNMAYKPVGSSASPSLVPKAMSENFGYDSHVRLVSRDKYTQEGWETLICHELQEGRPIIYGGFSPYNIGHQFVVDGVNTDGYYHVNWGWGGLCNGYFLLLDMTPTVSGTGGTSGYDGYNMDVHAVIGIQPPKDGSHVTPDNEPMITVSSMGIYTDDVYERNSMTKFFTNVQLTYEVCNNTPLSFETEQALLMLDDNDAIVGGAVSGMPIFQTTRTECFSGAIFGRNTYLNLTFGRNLKDGHYRIVSAFRLEENGAWILDEGTEYHYLDAIVTGNTLKLIAHPLAELHVRDVKFTGTQCAGILQDVKVTIENTGEDFSDNLYLFVNGKWVSGAGTLISSGDKADVHFRYMPEHAGSDELSITQTSSGSNPIYSSTFDIGENLSPSLSISELEIDNLDDDYNLYGNILNGSFVVTNTSDTDYSGKLRPVLYKIIEGFGIGVNCEEQYCTLSAGESTHCDLHLAGLLEYGSTYSIAIDHYIGAKAVRGSASMPFIPTKGVSTWTADGTYRCIPIGESLVVDAEVAAVEISAPIVSDIVTNSNPNTLYYIEKDVTIPQALDKSICILGNHCSAEITLTDEHDFYAPYSFTCPKASFVLIPQKIMTDNAQNLETIMLPFDVAGIYADSGQQLTTGGSHADIWLYEFAGEDHDRLLFERTEQLRANRPYLIGYVNLKNQQVRFVSDNGTKIHSSDQRMAQSGISYRFTPTSSFHPTITDLSGHAVSGWTVMLNEKPEGQGIATLVLSRPADVYTTTGRKVRSKTTTLQGLPAGVYIVNGRKLIVR